MSSSLQSQVWRWEKSSEDKRVLQPKLKLCFQEDVSACPKSENFCVGLWCSKAPFGLLVG